jgi:hypothetical protein
LRLRVPLTRSTMAEHVNGRCFDMQPAQYPVNPTGYPVPVAPAAKSLRVPAMFVQLGLGAYIVSAFADIALVGLFEKAVVRADEDTATDADRTLLLAGAATSLVVLMAVVFTVVAFIVWLYRARKNLVTWGIQGLRYGPGWAIGGWFIPIANLVIPKLVVDTVWSGSKLPPAERAARRSSNGLIWSWWLCLLVGNLMTNVAARERFTRDDTVAEIVGFNTPSTALMVVAAFLAIVLVRRITRMQEQRQAALDQPWQQMAFPAAPPS